MEVLAILARNRPELVLQLRGINRELRADVSDLHPLLRILKERPSEPEILARLRAVARVSDLSIKRQAPLRYCVAASYLQCVDYLLTNPTVKADEAFRQALFMAAKYPFPLRTQILRRIVENMDNRPLRRDAYDILTSNPVPAEVLDIVFPLFREPTQGVRFYNNFITEGVFKRYLQNMVAHLLPRPADGSPVVVFQEEYVISVMPAFFKEEIYVSDLIHFAGKYQDKTPKFIRYLQSDPEARAYIQTRQPWSAFYNGMTRSPLQNELTKEEKIAATSFFLSFEFPIIAEEYEFETELQEMIKERDKYEFLFPMIFSSTAVRNYLKTNAESLIRVFTFAPAAPIPEEEEEWDWDSPYAVPRDSELANMLMDTIKSLVSEEEYNRLDALYREFEDI